MIFSLGIRKVDPLDRVPNPTISTINLIFTDNSTEISRTMSSSLWDLLSPDIQIHIIEIASAKLIQETYHKNRSWYFRRLAANKKKYPDFTGKYYSSSDRVMIICKDRKIQYGTIISTAQYIYKCHIILCNGTKIYYDGTEHENTTDNALALPCWDSYKVSVLQRFGNDIVNISVLRPWNFCCCSVLKKNIKCHICKMRDGKYYV